MKERNSTAAISVKAPVIGLPRAMLYDRYEVLWKSFFSALGMKGIVSKPTNKAMIEAGSALAIDEACLSTKIYLGHIQSLIGKCDYILVPRISNFGLHRNMCTKFESLYDVVCNVFRNTDQKFVAYNVDALQKIDEEKAFVDLGTALGYDRKTAQKAYKRAKRNESEDWKKKVHEEEALYKSQGIKVLIVAHSYVLGDAYIGQPVLDYLKGMEVTPIRADQNNTSRTYFGTEGTYYVTPDGYAISAFEEDAASYAAAPSGLRVETLLEKLKEMQK